MMSDTQHTLGPFGLVPHKRWEPFTTSLIGSASREHPIALVDTADKEEGFANVRLFCAAPDLLATCERIDIWFDHNMRTETTIAFQRLRHELTSAIAKAKPKGGE